MKLFWARPLTRLEAALYGSIAAILVAVLAQQLLDAMEVAERTAMQATVAQLNAAISARLAYEVMRGEVGDVQAWTRRNPFELARARQANFVGDVASLERGSWAFDAERAELVYSPRLHLGLHTADPEGLLRFHGVAAYNGMGYVLVPTTPYRWQ